MTSIKYIRQMIEEGMTDAEIEEVVTDSQAARDEEEAAHGGSREVFSDTCGRNDAGEWIGMM